MKVFIIRHIEIEGAGLIEAFLRKKKISFEIITLNNDTNLPKIETFTHIIILGGPMSVYEEHFYPFLREEDFFIKEAIHRGKSILGICLGAQLIAKALGARVYKAPVKEVGWYDISLTKTGLEDPLFSDFPSKFSVFQWHGDTFEIPIGAKLIATSSNVTNQAFRYGENVYGLQFHLEVTKEMISQWIEFYEEEFRELNPNPTFLKNKIMNETKVNIENYKRRGMKFLKNFFTKT